MRDLKKKLSEQRVQLKRLNRAIIHWQHVAQLAVHEKIKYFDAYQDAMKRLNKEQSGRCFLCKKIRKYE